MKHPDFANDIDISAKYFAKEFSKKNEEGADYNYLISLKSKFFYAFIVRILYLCKRIEETLSKTY